jgi:hypothetical protein
MFELKIENIKGQILKLTQNESNYQVIEITGLEPPQAVINTVKSANRDGSMFNTSFLAERNVVITVALTGDVEKNRLKLYDVFSTGDYCKVYYSNYSRNIYCEGHVEAIETALFSQKQQVQISIICENPYLYALNQIYIDISKAFNNFEFPFAIEKAGTEIAIINENRRAEIINSGETTGIEMTLYTNTQNTVVSNPVIYNAKTGEFLKINTDIQYGEVVVVNTTKGKKSIKKIINGLEQNIINSLETGSTWHQLNSGHNVFDYSSDTGQTILHIEFAYNVVYKGV